MHPLTHSELEAAAHAYGLQPAALRALMAVESAGGGFLADDRPKILLEGHHVWRLLKARGIDPRPLAHAHPDACYPRWTRAYYLGGGAEWERLRKVVSYGTDHEPAHWESYKKAGYEACSWGILQLMGFNFAAAGFANVYDFKHAHEQSEAAQLAAALHWMKHEGILPLLQARDWTGFARRYNGSGQVAFYAGRLRAAYERLA